MPVPAGNREKRAVSMRQKQTPPWGQHSPPGACARRRRTVRLYSSLTHPCGWDEAAPPPPKGGAALAGQQGH